MRKKIGEGTFAVVYRVMNVSTGKQYALKKPKSGAALDDAAAWERESLIMDRINHVSPNKPNLHSPRRIGFADFLLAAHRCLARLSSGTGAVAATQVHTRRFR